MKSKPSRFSYGGMIIRDPGSFSCVTLSSSTCDFYLLECQPSLWLADQWKRRRDENGHGSPFKNSSWTLQVLFLLMSSVLEFMASLNCREGWKTSLFQAAMYPVKNQGFASKKKKANRHWETTCSLLIFQAKNQIPNSFRLWNLFLQTLVILIIIITILNNNKLYK